MKYRRLSLLTVITSALILTVTPTAYALSGSQWNAGNIISDYMFTNKAAMSVAEIQAFLNQKVGTGGYDSVPGRCDTLGARNAAPYNSSVTRATYAASIGKPTRWTCLNNYYEVPKTAPGPGIPANNYGSDTIPAGAVSAAQIIWNAAQQYNISPKVLLVTIQKESAGPLTSDDWPWLNQYTYAMGAHCPDTAPCDPNYAGFSIQISESAALFRYYLDNMTQPWWPYKKVGINSILYNPDTACGSSSVNIMSMATAALYTYTPYQPNQAALNNLYGSGDSCSAYGNRNFWRTYNDWFGSSISNLLSVNDAVYLIENGLKRVFPDGITFLSNSYKWSDVLTVSSLELSKIPDGAVVPYYVHFRDGKYVKSPDSDGVYLIENGLKRPIPDGITLLSYSYKWSDVLTVSSLELSKIPDGAVVPYYVHFRDGKLIKAPDSGSVYLVENGLKRPIQDGATFLSYSYKWSDIVTVSALEVSKIPAGSVLTKKI